jgi:hypothetical protein
MEFIEVEYNQDLKPLESALSGVKRPGDFFVSGAIEIPMPKVNIEGAATLSFPIPEAQVAAIVRHAERAPYGRGEKTIVDTSVRRVWQIAASKVQVSGKSWATNFEAILSRVAAGLGCEGVTVAAELYKLLVYDKDGFFLPHRDTEKSDGMFGTLVLTLPSAYGGGELRIRHAGREVTIDTSGAEFSELAYVAFYADCEHEALPVREGNRVCLVYNLIQKRAKGKGKRGILRAPEYVSQIADAAGILDRFLRAAGAPAKIAWLLEHQYSAAGLSFSGLKGPDAAKTRVLVQAAATAKCAVHLGIVHIGESGAGEPDYDDEDYSYRSGRNRYWDDEDWEGDDDDWGGAETDAEADEAGEGFTAVTVDDNWQYVDEWRDENDVAVKFGSIPIAAGELLPAGALDGEPPDNKRLLEASGNEGATYERSYHRAVLVLWPQERYAEVLLQAGVVAALPYLKQLAEGGERARTEAVALAERMLESWSSDSQRWDSFRLGGGRPQPEHRCEMIAALVKLKAPALLERFIGHAVAASYDGSENAALISSVDALGDAKAAAVLSDLVSSRMPGRPNECTELLLSLSEDPSRCFPEVAEAAVAGLDRIGERKAEPDDLEWEQEERRSLGPEFLENLFLALRRFESGTLCWTAAEKIASHPEIFSPVTLVVPGLQRMSAGSDATGSSVAHLWTRSAEFLLERSDVPPAPPSDWRLHVKLSCSCEDCRELQMFARDPVERVHRFRANKERRRHLHGTIDKHKLDMKHVTERVGSPYTLVCTKDRRSFDRRMKQYRQEIAAMRALVEMSPASGAASALCARMNAAIAAAVALKHDPPPKKKSAARRR